MTTKITQYNIETGAITVSKLSNTIVSDFISTAAPKINVVSIASNTYTVLDDTAVNVGGGYIVITGTGFQSGAQVLIEQSLVSSVSYVNSTTLHAEVPAKSAATYNLYVTNPDGGTGVKVNGLTYSSNPYWVTDSSFSEIYDMEAISNTFQATGATTINVASGSTFPTGLTLDSSNAYYYGAINVTSNTTYTFTLDANDDELQTASRTFTLPVKHSAWAIHLGTSYTTGNNNVVSVDLSPHKELLARYNELDLIYPGTYRLVAQGITQYPSGSTESAAIYFSGGSTQLSNQLNINATTTWYKQRLIGATFESLTFNSLYYQENQPFYIYMQGFTSNWTSASLSVWLVKGTALGGNFQDSTGNPDTGLTEIYSAGIVQDGCLILAHAHGKLLNGNIRTAAGTLGPYFGVASTPVNVKTLATSTDVTFNGVYGPVGVTENEDAVVASASDATQIVSMVTSFWNP